MLRGKRAPSRSFKDTDIGSLAEEYGSGPRSSCEWDKHKRPPAHICSQKYCFMWISAREAIGKLPAVPEGRCGLETEVVCTRLDPLHGEADCYEPCEPELEADDLPWFYFIAPAEMLASPFRKKYVRLTRELWGEEGEDAEGAAPDAGPYPGR